jgi:mono/diheme cytochrome c family protein
MADKNPLPFRDSAAMFRLLMRPLSSIFCALLAFAVVSSSRGQVLPQFQTAPTAPATTPAPTFTPAGAITAPAAKALQWDSIQQKYDAKPGESSAPFTFHVTNVSKAEVSITRLQTSCGCTVAQLPPLPNEPFKLLPGSNVAINVTMDLRGKAGAVSKMINVDSSDGHHALTVVVTIPPPAPIAASGDPHAAPNAMGNRALNIQNALADRQAIFKGDCASCHVQKGVGKFGQELYAASCGICHDAEHRAAMVPDLKVPRSERDLAFWQKWIMEGKPGTLMPAFAQAHGGPLTQEQIDSLTVYLFQTYPKKPQAVAATPITPPTPAVQKN